MEHLMECPFCGGEAHVDTLMVERGWWSAQVWCAGVLDGSCGTRLTCGGKSEDDAVDFAVRSWNMMRT